jgi:hypothetical protein
MCILASAGPFPHFAFVSGLWTSSPKLERWEKVGGGRQVSMTRIALNIVKGSYLYVIPPVVLHQIRLLYAKDRRNIRAGCLGRHI